MKNYLLFGFGVMSLWSSGLFGSDTDDYAEPRRTRNREFKSIQILSNTSDSGCLDLHIPRSMASETLSRAEGMILPRDFSILFQIPSVSSIMSSDGSPVTLTSPLSVCCTQPALFSPADGAPGMRSIAPNMQSSDALMSSEETPVATLSSQHSPIIIVNDRMQELMESIHYQGERLHELQRTIMFLRLAIINDTLEYDTARGEHMNTLQQEMQTLRQAFINNSVELDSFLVSELVGQ